MQTKNFLKFCFLFCGGLIITFSLILGVLRLLLPNDLTFVEGRATEITSPIPISIKTNEDTMSVLSVTANPITDNFSLDLGTTMVANAVSTGVEDLTFYLCNTVPIKTISAEVIQEQTLIPVGQSVGITLDTDGLLVLGTGRIAVENENSDDDNINDKTVLVEPAKGIIKTGDLLRTANGVDLVNKETLQEVVNDCNGEDISLVINRDGVDITEIITPEFSYLEQEYKIGLWIRDSIQGIGTITYYNPETGEFGGLGHGIYDVDTGDLMPMKQGMVISSNLTEIVKGKKGEPGELTGTVQKNTVLGTVEINSSAGIYGTMDIENIYANETMGVGFKQDVQIGEATILSNVEGDEIKAYSIEIQSVNGSEGKEMKIQITDPELLEKTGGIIQGMSGSPILQNGRLIGAVTHVFVNDPTRGYGIFIENMLQASE